MIRSFKLQDSGYGAGDANFMVQFSGANLEFYELGFDIWVLIFRVQRVLGVSV